MSLKWKLVFVMLGLAAFLVVARWLVIVGQCLAIGKQLLGEGL